jgi:hypothetical protein
VRNILERAFDETILPRMDEQERTEYREDLFEQNYERLLRVDQKLEEQRAKEIQKKMIMARMLEKSSRNADNEKGNSIEKEQRKST